MQKFIQKPDITLYPGVVVDKDTVLRYKSESGHIVQKVENLVFHSMSKVEGDGFESVIDTTIQLKNGDILILEEGGRGYIKPVEPFVTIEEAIADLTNMKDLG